MKNKISLWARAFMLAAMMGAAWAAQADDFPSRPVRLVVPSSPGGALDVLARLVAPRLSEKWGQSVVVENHAGAGGIIGTGIVATAPPDGHTLLIVTTGFATNPYLYKNLPYRTPGDFTPITILALAPNVLVAPKSFGPSSVREVVELAKANPGHINFASSGVGSGGHLSMELLNHTAGIQMTHVPYSGAGAAMSAVLAGQVQLLFTAVGAALPQVNNKSLKAIAVTSKSRMAVLPDVPTVAESGLPGYEADGWYALMGPAGLPKNVLGKIYRDVLEVLKQPAIASRFRSLGFEQSGMPSDEFARYIDSQIVAWKGVLENIPPQGGAKSAR